MGNLDISIESTCWQCGAAAAADCSHVVKLYANARAELDSLGHDVQRGKLTDKLTLRVPRCVACRSRRRREFAILGMALLLGSVIGQIIIPQFWPRLGLVPPMDPSVESRGSVAQAIGAVSLLLVALTTIVWRHRAARLRDLLQYPPVMQAKQIGWRTGD